jgi:hypothetical protein
MTTDPWAEATFDGLERAQRRRIAAWTPAERLAWLEETVADLDERGLLAPWRERKQREVTSAWEAGAGAGQVRRGAPPP